MTEKHSDTVSWFMELDSTFDRNLIFDQAVLHINPARLHKTQTPASTRPSEHFRPETLASTRVSPFSRMKRY
ncbi:MAG: hypothetical protein ABL931_17040 [Usitatibacteraceae bacterium]